MKKSLRNVCDTESLQYSLFEFRQIRIIFGQIFSLPFCQMNKKWIFRQVEYEMYFGRLKIDREELNS